MFISYILSAPIGIIVGAAISTSSIDTTLVIIQSLSAGTFVYLACCDLIVHEFQKNSTDTQKERSLKLVSLLLGCSFVVLLMVALPGHKEH